MMEQPDLLGWTPPPIPAPAQRHSPTSVEAAVKIQKAIGPLHKRILAYLAAHPEGGTDIEMQDALEMNPSTQRPRRIELAALGKVENFGCTRLTSSGRKATVWHLKQLGGDR